MPKPSSSPFDTDIPGTIEPETSGSPEPEGYARQANFTHDDWNPEILLRIREEEKKISPVVPDTDMNPPTANFGDQMGKVVKTHPLFNSPDLDGAAEGKLNRNTLLNPVTEENQAKEKKEYQLKLAQKLAKEKGFAPEFTPYRRS